MVSPLLAFYEYYTLYYNLYILTLVACLIESSQFLLTTFLTYFDRSITIKRQFLWAHNGRVVAVFNETLTWDTAHCSLSLLQTETWRIMVVANPWRGKKPGHWIQSIEINTYNLCT